MTNPPSPTPGLEFSISSAPTAVPSMSDLSTNPTTNKRTSRGKGDEVNVQIQSGIDVAAAEATFEDLRRQLSKSSAHRTARGDPPTRDLEKGAKGSMVDDDNDEDDFDLVSYLRSTSERSNAAGIKHKRLSVTFTDLSVTGAGGIKIFIRVFPNAVIEFLLSPMLIIGGLFGWNPFKTKEKMLLQGFQGAVRPGEMVLVLGRPGSGCSTFLKTIANQRGGYISVDGEVLYGGIESQEITKRFPGEVVYNQEDDVHHPTLTVGQTLRFALSTKTPGKRLPEHTAKSFQDTVLDVMLKMLNITHTKHTKVGNEFIRGVSGGERKRVSIAEMMATSACVLSWDNSTRGLDASTALDFAKSLRILTDIYGMTTFVSLYQAGEGIYDQFDKVLVIDEGREVYFGPANEARQYFIDMGFKDLPRQTTADYLTGCTDPNERQFAPGRSASNVPSTPEAMASYFNSSPYYTRLVKEREEIKAQAARDNAAQEEFRQAVIESKRSGVRQKSPRTVSFWTQVWALTVRQMQLKMQNVFDIVTGYTTAIGIALITGSVYLNLPTTSAGAFTRGGVLFIALLFNSLNAFYELPAQMMGRPILYKQLNYQFYRPSAFSLAGMLADIPLSSLQLLIFGIIIYFMSGLARNAGGFFTFFLLIWVTFLAMSAFFRTIGTVCSNFDVAARLAAVLISAMVLYSQYLIPVFAMKRWLFWISYINPLRYGFAGLMENEFGRVTFSCEGANIIPRNGNGATGYPDGLGPNQICTLPGATPGSSVVPGSDYIRVAFEYNSGEVWKNFGIIVAFFVGFQLIQMFCMEYFQHGAHSSAITVFQKEDEDRKARNEHLMARKDAFRKGEAEQNLSGMFKSDRPFTWSALNYTVPVPGGHRKLLDDVYGYVKPGTLTALMGASGAGKTTLLDVLANRKSIGVISGDILVGGRPIGIDFQRGTAYAEQLDVHEYTATVREAFRFSAYLRQPHDVPISEKDDYVEEIIQLLELEDYADAMIGFPGFGLGVEARKRVTIGVELAAKPKLLLFLDEPTSGLDGQSAYNIVRFLKKLAAAGQAILCTIHQPNALLFEQFDNLLLLQRGGQTVYFGPVGKDSAELRAYFRKYGAECPPSDNPAEFMLEAIGAGSRRRIGPRDWADVWRDSEECAGFKREIEELKAKSLARPVEDDPDAEREYATPFLYQLKVVSTRMFTTFWRSPDYGFTRFFNHVIIALFTALTFLQLDNSVQSLQYRVFAIFIATVMPALILSQIEPCYIMGRQTFNRESSSKMYSQSVFALSMLAAETPYSILCAVGYFVAFYYPAGFNYASSRAGYTFFIILITELFSVTLGQAVAALSPSIQVAATMNPFLLIIFSLFCGVTIPKPNLPKFWREWMYQLNPFTRLVGGMIVTELHDLEVRCKDSEFYRFNPPSGQTCEGWAGSFINATGGYLDNPGDTSNCRYCRYRLGDEFYAPLDLSYGDRWRDLGIFIAFTAFNIIVLLIAARFLRYNKR